MRWRGFEGMIQDGLAPQRQAIQTLKDFLIYGAWAVRRGKKIYRFL